MLCFNYILLLLNFLIRCSNNKFLLKEEQYSKEYTNLLNFIQNNGGYINPKLIPFEISEINRYIISKEKIYKNEILLFIPNKISLSKLNVLINSKCVEVYGFDEELDYACLVYFMTIDKYNLSSIFKPYYNYLPKIDKSDFITNFTKDEIEMFKNISITKGIKYYHYFYDKAFLPAKEKLINFSKLKNIKYENIIEEFKYNYDMVLTRNFGRPDSFYDINSMVPYLDLINHSDKNNTYWFYEDNKEGYTLKAMRYIDKNEEITCSYGKYHNKYLYLTYGFVIPGNKYHEKINIDLCNENFDLNIDDIKNDVENIFMKIIQKYKKNINKTKNCIIKDLIDKKNYYLKIKTDRFCMNVIIKEHLEAINKFIYEISNFKSLN